MNKLAKRRSHPLHMMLVHFPSALYPFSCIMEIIGWYFKDSIYCMVAIYSLIGAVAGAVLAILSGFLEFTKVAPDTKVWKLVLWHGGLNMLWLIIFGILLAIRFRGFSNLMIAETWYLVTLSGATIGLFVSNYLGGELVVNHGVGTINQDIRVD